MYIITNNRMANAKYAGIWTVFYEEIPAKELLICARDKIHAGHSLLTHPLSGSVKPYENPYKTLAISEKPQRKADGMGQVDFHSLEIMENAIATFDKFKGQQRSYPTEMLEDFRLIDLSLFNSSLFRSLAKK